MNALVTKQFEGRKWGKVALLDLLCSFIDFAGFLTAMRQEVTRAHKGWALDTVTIHNEVLKQVREEIIAAPAVCMKCVHWGINFSTPSGNSR